MGVHRILRPGHPDLRRPALGCRGRLRLPRAAWSTTWWRPCTPMKDWAWWQIGNLRRIAVIEIQPGNTRYPGAVPTGRCWSIALCSTALPGRLPVRSRPARRSRPPAPHRRRLRPDGTPRHLEPEDLRLPARDGTLFIDRLTDTTRLAFLDEYREFHATASSNPT